MNPIAPRGGPHGRDDAFRTLYLEHHAAVSAYFGRRAGREDVEDLVAETFVVAWRKMPSRVRSPLPWLYAVSAKVLANHRRRMARDLTVLGMHAEPASDAPVVADEGLAAAFAQLSEKAREAICLTAWEGLGTVDAARAAGCSPATFAVRLSRARRQLRGLLDENPSITPRTETADGCSY